MSDEIASNLVRFVDASATATLLFDRQQRVLYANRAAVALAKIVNAQDKDRILDFVHDWHPDLLPAEAMHACLKSGDWMGEVVLNVTPGSRANLLVQLSMLGRGHTWPCGLYVRDTTDDYTREAELHARNAELEITYAKIKGVQEQAVQSEKLASIGQLAAGVAHEINNPIGYINSNLSTLQQYVANFLTIVEICSDAIVRSGDPAAVSALEEARRRFDLDFLATDVGQLLTESREGIDRVCKIVQDLKEFSRGSHKEDWVKADIHKGLDSTLNIAWNELKYKSEVIKTFGDLPLVECLPSELNQVFLNILLNAGHAIKERGLITVSTGCSNGKIWIAIADDGEGIPEDVLPRIFEPFFTTKPVGSGTGLGLAISYGIVAKHHGTIEVTSVPGQGTLFRIELPTEQPSGLI
ncbi:MAG: ATP-binding protein [Dokdonella sp.]